MHDCMFSMLMNAILESPQNDFGTSNFIQKPQITTFTAAHPCGTQSGVFAYVSALANQIHCVCIVVVFMTVVDDEI